MKKLFILIFLFGISWAAPAWSDLEESEGCEMAKSIGAGVRSYGSLTASEQLDANKFRRDFLKKWDECHEKGRKHGMLSDDEIEEKIKRETLSPEAFLEWKTNKKLREIEERVKRAERTAVDAYRTAQAQSSPKPQPS